MTDTTPAITIGSAIDGVRFVQRAFLRPSKTNPRTRFPDGYITELAASIKKVGVMQTLVARPIKEAKPGEPQLEIVAGECRWRASEPAGVDVLPVWVRELTDLEVMELQLFENLKRKDLHPLEEARGYEQLLRNPPHGKPRLQGYTMEELAEKSGVSVRQIYVTVQLLQLIPEAQTAMFEDKLSRSVGLLIARMPRELQAKALADVLQGWGGEPYSYRNASKVLRERYMLTLVKAPFDIKDAALVKKAGACTACPKRTGANPDLFEDVQSEDVCTDPGCFERKKKAAGDRQLEQAKADGLQVLEGAEAKKVLPYGGYSEYHLGEAGYVRLDKPAEELTGSKQQLRTVLGDDVKPVLIKGEGMDTPVLVIKKDEATKALKAKGLFKPSKPGRVGEKTKALTPEDIKKQRDHRVTEKLEQRLPKALATHLDDDGQFGLPDKSSTWMYTLADKLFYASEIDQGELGTLMTGKTVNRWGTDWLKDLPVEKLVQTILMIVLFDAVVDEGHNPSSRGDKVGDKLAKEIGFDLAALRKEVTTEVDGAIRDEIEALKSAVAPKPAAKKAAKKPVSARAAGASTPPLNAAAQGAKTAQKAPQAKAAQPQDATAAFLAANAPPAAKKAPVAKGKKGQSDKPEASPTSQAKKPSSSKPKAASQKDKPAAPARLPKVGERWRRTARGTDAWPFPTEANGTVTVYAPGDTHATLLMDNGETRVVAIDSLEFLADAKGPAPKIGERWRVRPGVPGRAKTAGREGEVAAVNEEGERVTLRWGPKRHEISVYAFDQVEFVSAAEPKVELSPVAAWPFPTHAV